MLSFHCYPSSINSNFVSCEVHTQYLQIKYLYLLRILRIFSFFLIDTLLPILPSNIVLHTFNNDMNMYSFSVLLPFNFTSNQTMEVSPDSSLSLINDTFVVTLQSDVFYNITVHSLNQKWVYEIGKGYICNNI